MSQSSEASEHRNYWGCAQGWELQLLRPTEHVLGNEKPPQRPVRRSWEVLLLAAAGGKPHSPEGLQPGNEIRAKVLKEIKCRNSEEKAACGCCFKVGS